MSISHESINNYKIYYLTQAQYDALVVDGSITVDGQTIVYDPNAEYRTPDTTGDVIASALTSVPNAGSVSSAGVISFKHGSTVLFTVQLPLYTGGVSNGT